GRAWLGDVSFVPGRLKIAELVASTWPVFAAGIEQDDFLDRLDGRRLQSGVEMNTVLDRHKPGDRIEIVFTDRAGQSRTATVTLAESPHLEVVPIESAGGRLTPAQQAFRARWLGAPN